MPYIKKEKFLGKTEESRQRQLENLLVGRAKRVLDTFFLKEEKRTLIEADTGVISRQGSLYDLSKIRIVMSREIYQAS